MTSACGFVSQNRCGKQIHAVFDVFAFRGVCLCVPQEAGNGFDPEWFCRDYSVTYDEEDRATVYEAYFTESPEWWEGHPHIRKKLDRILLFLEDTYGWENP